MSDSYSTQPGEGAVLAADEIGGVKYPRVKVVFGDCGEYTDVTPDNPLPVSLIGGDASPSGGLTNTELRASAVPVSGTFYQATQPVSGTFWQTTQPVSGTFWQSTQPVSIAGTVAVSGSFYPATQPVSGTVAVSGNVAVTGTFFQATQPVSGTVTANAGSGTFAVSGPITDAQLRATAVPVSGTFFQSTQPVSIAATVATRHLKDNARVIVNAATAIAGVTAVTSEALLSLNISRDGAATAGATTIAVTSGKKLRIIGITAGVISTAAAVISARVALRMNPSGAVASNSPILAILPMSQQAAALAQAGDSCVLMLSEAIEISGTMQVGLSQLCSATTGTVWASLIAYEY